MSENITVRSIVDRFLEHSRIFYFENACQPEVFVGSADWMPRNFFRRIEVVFPIEDGNLRERDHQRNPRRCRWPTTPRRASCSRTAPIAAPQPADGEKPRRSQFEFMALATGGERSRSA